MSDLNTSPSIGAMKRNLPSWMSSVSKQNASKPDGKELAKAGAHEENDEGETLKQAKGHGKSQTSKTPSKENEGGDKSSAPNLVATKFSKQLEGVVFVLSGFVNPERSVLRSQALEMGAEYQPDWNSDCTLLVCAFPNTPKFRQVEADCGTIVSKEWISECYNQKRLVDIDSYLMHAGKPWRRQSIFSHEASQDQESTASRKSQKHVVRVAHSKPTTSASSKSIASNPAKDCFPPLKVKKWAIDDLSKTVLWLESQEEKPETSEIKKVAAEGILTCLQDTIDSLEQEQSIQQITEQWNFIPRVVEELAKLEGTGDGLGSLTKKDLYKQAVTCKEIYEVELGNLDNVSLVKNKKLKTSERDAPAYDSDETIEMTEEDIDQAYNVITSKLTPTN